MKKQVTRKPVGAYVKSKKHVTTISFPLDVVSNIRHYVADYGGSLTKFIIDAAREKLERE